MSSPLSHNLTRSFAALLALLLFLVAFSMRNFRALSDSTSLSLQTYKVITGTLDLESTIFAIDNGTRGFLVSGEKNSLASYRANLRTYRQRFDTLRMLTSDNPAQQRNLDGLDAAKKRWIGELLEPLIAKRQRLLDANSQFDVARTSSVVRRRTLARLVKITEGIKNIERGLLQERSAEQRRVKWWTQFTLLTGGVFSVLLTLFLVAFASKNARRLDQTNALLGEAKTRAEAANAHLLETNAQLAQEVSARRGAEEKLRRGVLDLQRSNAELEQFAYVASHDLQEPLRAVGGCVQVLQRRYQGQLDARADQFIQHAVDGVQRMQNLINDLLAYSRVGTKNQAFEAVAGAGIVAGALRSLSVARAESDAQITVDEVPDLICDAGQIEQVLQNLISNALKFRGQAPPKIHIGYATQKSDGADFHVLSIEDAGLGIEPQYFERIFVMFQRLHTRTDYAGTGIGLAICKKIVERHGGKIWVESWTGEAKNGASTDGAAKTGTKFSFSLPVQPEIESAEPIEAPRKENGAGNFESAPVVAPPTAPAANGDASGVKIAREFASLSG